MDRKKFMQAIDRFSPSYLNRVLAGYLKQAVEDHDESRRADAKTAIRWIRAYQKKQVR